MNTTLTGPVWIDPPRYWAAIANKSEKEIDALLESITTLWHHGQIEALFQFDFVIGVGYPYPGECRSLHRVAAGSCTLASEAAMVASPLNARCLRRVPAKLSRHPKTIPTTAPMINHIDI
jgi:hypothetical protein